MILHLNQGDTGAQSNTEVLCETLCPRVSLVQTDYPDFISSDELYKRCP